MKKIVMIAACIATMATYPFILRNASNNSIAIRYETADGQLVHPTELTGFNGNPLLKQNDHITQTSIAVQNN